MLTQLLASRPVRQRSITGLGASMTLHGLFVVGAVATTVAAPRPPAPAMAQRVVYIPPEPATASATKPRQATPSVPGMPGLVSPPIQVPTMLPIADPGPSLGPSFPPGPYVIGPRATPAVPVLPAGTPYLAAQVEVPVVLATGSPIPRFPAAMRFAGVEGEARFQFVVDTIGRVELATVREIQSTHEAFALAVRGTLPRMRFTPARVGGQAVRQLVEFPAVFRLRKD